MASRVVTTNPSILSTLRRGLAVSVAAASVLSAPARAAEAPPAAADTTYRINLPGHSLTPAAKRPDWRGLAGGVTGARRHVLVQLHVVPDTAARTELARAGLALGDALGGRAWFATIRRDLDPAAKVLALVRFAAPVALADKLAATLDAVAKSPAPKALPARGKGQRPTLIRLFADGSTAAVESRVKELGGSVLGKAPAFALIAAALPARAPRALAALDDVRFIEPLAPLGAGESDRARAHVHAGVPPIPPGGVDGHGVVVGVFEDAHAFLDHQDLAGRIVQGDTGPLRSDQHPTLVAGLIAGDGTASRTAGASADRQWRGIAPAASVRSYNFNQAVNDNGSQATTLELLSFLDDIAQAVKHDGVVVANNSWGTPSCDDVPYGRYLGLAPRLDDIVRGSLGRPVTVVFSAGNGRKGLIPTGATAFDTHCLQNATAPYSNFQTLDHPHSAKNVITVGAIDSTNGAMSAYSAWGPTADGRFKPDLVASGHHDGVMAAGVSEFNPTVPTTPDERNAILARGYRVPDGPGATVYGAFAMTSNAAAIVSGGAALVIDAWRRQFPGGGDPLPSTVKALLVHDARDLVDPSAVWYRRGPDAASGYGLVQVNETVASVARHEAIEGRVIDGSVAHYLLRVASQPSLKVTLAWDDLPSVEDASPTLINDLDLVVTDPNGARHFPWPSTTPQASEDHANNLEQVVVDAPAPGVWRVDVRGTHLQDEQRFSLVAASDLRLFACDRGRTVCDTDSGPVCVDLTSDAGACGACGHACASFASGAVCQAGACVCGAGQQVCGDPPQQTCAALATDFRNCGQCGHACASGEICANAACAACGAGTAACAGTCVSLDSDPANCGRCGVRCPSDHVCRRGACAPACSPACRNPQICCPGPGGALRCAPPNACQ